MSTSKGIAILIEDTVFSFLLGLSVNFLVNATNEPWGMILVVLSSFALVGNRILEAMIDADIDINVMIRLIEGIVLLVIGYFVGNLF
ncbi:MAG: hypothetical protein INQ03_20880 [Candidatus Heimdallarchaeota archaeon]|nr:hypothetical protein [Candidatus Heimdallarchaeota archaeon]